MISKNKFMLRAIELSISSANGTGGPFGCVIVKDDKIIAEGSNKVTFSNDPTAHAEIVAIRDACKKMNISLVGGHTEITPQVNSPIAIGCLLGEVPKNQLIKTSGAVIGDDILITKFIGLEGTSILANDIKSKNLKIDNVDHLFLPKKLYPFG